MSQAQVKGGLAHPPTSEVMIMIPDTKHTEKDQNRVVANLNSFGNCWMSSSVFLALRTSRCDYSFPACVCKYINHEQFPSSWHHKKWVGYSFPGWVYKISEFLRWETVEFFFQLLVKKKSILEAMSKWDWKFEKQVHSEKFVGIYMYVDVSDHAISSNRIIKKFMF